MGTSVKRLKHIKKRGKKAKIDFMWENVRIGIS